MVSTSEYIQGKVRFAFTNRLNQFGKWVVGLYPDAPSMVKVNKLIDEGIKNELKRDDDGDWIAFSCPPDKEDRQGRKFTIAAPVVIDADGKTYLGDIGAGSDVSLKLEVYGGKTRIGTNYKAARLRGVKIHNLVPYIPANQAQDPFEQKTAEGLGKLSTPTENW